MKILLIILAIIITLAVIGWVTLSVAAGIAEKMDAENDDELF